MKSSSFHKGKRILFLTGCALGAVCFLWVYGARVLNPFYDSWLFNADIDLSQHYIGFCHYRMSAWHFPIGLIDTLSYPTSMSVIYTDSIPLFALLFKILSPVLPQHFQYFGLFGILCFMLMGGYSSLLIYRLISGSFAAGEGADNGDGADNGIVRSRFTFVDRNLAYILSAVCSLIYILSSTMLQRMFYHTSLAAQWLVIAAMYLWVSRDDYTKWGILIRYAVLGLLCVGIHTYFVPMVGSILLASSVETVIRKKSGENSGAAIRDEAGNLIGFCIAGLLTLFAFGGFYGSSSGFGEGIGSFTANLNTFINPLYGSIILKPMRILYGFQYEGYAYLGLGVFMLIIAAFVYLVWALRENGKESYFKVHLRQAVGLILFIVDLFLAVFPTAAVSDFRIIGVPLGPALSRMLGVFRSNGRFIWVCEYLIFTWAAVSVIRLLKDLFDKRLKGRDIILKIMIVAVLLEVLDWLTDQNSISDSEYYHCLDLDHVAAMGQSCGGAQVLGVAHDPRIKTCVMLNSGIGDMSMMGSTPETLKDLHQPMFYMIGGPADIAYENAQLDYERIADNIPVVMLNSKDGHSGTYYEKYGGNYAKAVVKWLDWQLKGRVGQSALFLDDEYLKMKFPEWQGVRKNF